MFSRIRKAREVASKRKYDRCRHARTLMITLSPVEFEIFKSLVPPGVSRHKHATRLFLPLLAKAEGDDAEASER